jgi:hypothetical protein
MVNVFTLHQTKNLVVVHGFQEHPSEFYLERNHKLVCQSDNCISANGDYSQPFDA